LVASLLSPDAAGHGPEHWRSLRSHGPVASEATSSLVASLLSPDAAGHGPEHWRSLRSPPLVRERGRYLAGAAAPRLKPIAPAAIAARISSTAPQAISRSGGDSRASRPATWLTP